MIPATDDALYSAASALVTNLQPVAQEIEDLVDEATPNKLVVSLSIKAGEAKQIHRIFKELAMMTGNLKIHDLDHGVTVFAN